MPLRVTHRAHALTIGGMYPITALHSSIAFHVNDKLSLLLACARGHCSDTHETLDLFISTSRQQQQCCCFLACAPRRCQSHVLICRCQMMHKTTSGEGHSASLVLHQQVRGLHFALTHVCFTVCLPLCSCNTTSWDYLMWWVTTYAVNHACMHTYMRNQQCCRLTVPNHMNSWI